VEAQNYRALGVGALKWLDAGVGLVEKVPKQTGAHQCTHALAGSTLDILSRALRLPSASKSDCANHRLNVDGEERY
jgi:hypothetical protein